MCVRVCVQVFTNYYCVRETKKQHKNKEESKCTFLAH